MYALIRDIHFYFSRVGLVAALVMLIIASYLGHRSRDVTPYFRRATYAIAGLMLVESALGGALYLQGGRPGQEVHYVYGGGAVLALPFFIFVEVTARKRPAIGSYIWGFTMLAGVIIRSILTGAR